MKRFFLWLLIFMGSSASAETITLPLFDIYPVDAVELRCVDSKYDIQLPIPSRWKVNRATLKFSYVNSASVLKQNSQLVVRLNGTPLAQMKLDPFEPEAEAEIELPKLLLQSGYNHMSFQVSQHYTLQCESPCAPELWTRLNLDQATVTFDYELRDVPERVSSVANFLFDPKSPIFKPIHIISENRSEKMLTYAGVVASGVATRFEYKPTRFTSSNDIVLNHDNILVGTKAFVEQFLAERDIKVDIDSPTIKVMPVPVPYVDDTFLGEEQLVYHRDKKHALLVISGVDEQQVQLAVESFDILSIPFPDSKTMKVYEFNLPEIGLYSGKHMLVPDRKYPFKKLNYDTYTYLGFAAGRQQITFRLPPDFHIKPNQYVVVSLNFAYGAGFRNDSVFNVLLNDKHVAAIHLDNPKGGIISEYEISLPTYLFQGGTNTLDFAPALTPQVSENCGFLQSDNLFLTLFDSSTLEFPAMPHRIDMPRLDLMFVNGFPFTRWPDGYESLIHVTSLDDDTVAAAFNMMGMLSQKNGYPLISGIISPALPSNYQGELMIIGEIEKIPPYLMEGAPLKVDKDRYRVPYPVFSSWDEKTSIAFSTQSSDMSLDKGLLMQFESPVKKGRSVVMITGKSSTSVEHMSRALLKTDVQGASTGDLVMVDFIYDTENAELTGNNWRYSTTSVKTGKKYVTGKSGKIDDLQSVLAANPLYYWMALTLVIFLLSLLIFIALRRRRYKRIKE